jgi:molybdopterin converting factor small subunit
MKYTVKLFGIFEDEIGKANLNIETKESLTMDQLQVKLHNSYPILDEVQHYMIAVNQEYCSNLEQILTENDEIALIPPIAGG